MVGGLIPKILFVTLTPENALSMVRFEREVIPGTIS